jgi:signal transduction histidine kinase
VVVTVADTGEGIGPADLRTLFQPFRTTKTDGLGIGLYECKRVIEAHGGTIRVESEVGRGTSVRIELPIEKGGSRLTFNG